MSINARELPIPNSGLDWVALEYYYPRPGTNSLSSQSDCVSRCCYWPLITDGWAAFYSIEIVIVGQIRLSLLWIAVIVAGSFNLLFTD